MGTSTETSESLDTSLESQYQCRAAPARDLRVPVLSLASAWWFARNPPLVIRLACRLAYYIVRMSRRHEPGPSGEATAITTTTKATGHGRCAVCTAARTAMGTA